ncbi:MAG: MFS transporter [Deltaproteobacteria bacterium]|nr:MFS transporter [Deltaproteobacteria bacterium]
MTETKLTNRRLIAFALPSFVTALMFGPIGSILPTIYAKYYALDLAFIGTVLMVSRIFDAVTDPAIGYLSDRTRTPLGQRKPWIIAGYALTIIAVYRLFVPPDVVEPLYFLVWFILLYLFLTLAEIPYAAWQAEITRDYRVRSKVVTFRVAFASVGGLVFAASPLLPIFETHEMTPAVLKIVALMVAVLLPISVLLAVVFAPRGKPVAVRVTGTILTLLRDFSRNKPFLIFAASFLFAGLAAGMQQVLGFLYFDTYLGIGHRFPEILIAMSAAQLLSMPMWLRLMNKFGKHRAFSVGLALSVIFSLGLIFLRPGPSVFPVFMALWICMMFMFGAVMVIPGAIMGDVIDYDILKSGSNRAGQYFAVFTLAVKFNLGVGGGLAFFLVDMFGYDAAATIHDRTSMIGMYIAMAILPSIFFFISSLIMWRFPIDERRHSIIRRRIESRSSRSQDVMQN